MTQHCVATQLLSGAGEELTLADLMQGLGGDAKRKLPGTTRKLLEKMSEVREKALAVYTSCCGGAPGYTALQSQ